MKEISTMRIFSCKYPFWVYYQDREGREGKVTSRLHFPIFCGGGKKKKGKSKFQVHIPEGKKILLFPFLGSHLFFLQVVQKKPQGMTLWFLRNGEQGSISILGKRLLTKKKNRKTGVAGLLLFTRGHIPREYFFGHK